MHLITDEGLSLLLKRIRNKIALRSNLDNKVDKEEGKDLSDNDFTNNHKELLNNAIDSVSVEHSTGKSHITFLNSEINNNIKLDIDTGCDLFFYPVLNNASRELDGSIIIPYTYISKEGCDIGKVSVTMSYMYKEDIDPISQVFEINSKEDGELVLTNAPDKAGWVNYSFTILGDTNAIKTNFMEYENVLIKVFASYRTSERNMLPGSWDSAPKVVSEDLENGTYKTTVYAQEGNTSITFANNKKILEIYHIANHITSMYNAFNNCTNLTGSPVCGPNVTNMYYTYYKCSNITGTPVCGDKVTSMYYTYYKCSNITGTPVCGNSVTNMVNTYYDCNKLTGTPVCGDKVTNFASAYSYCSNLTGPAVCGPNVTDMSATYTSCSNLTGEPVCGPNVTNMVNAYCNCYNLTGSPVIGDKVTNMCYTYYNCTKLTGSPVCGLNVTNMGGAYSCCNNLTGSPVIGDNVTNATYAYMYCNSLTGSPTCGNSLINMFQTYAYCNNLTGSPVCGPNVTNMYCTYGYCVNLTGSPVCGDKVTDISFAYDSCANLKGAPVCGNNVTDMCNAYANCTNLTGNPACGPNVNRMYGAYQNCFNLTGTATCGNNVTNMCYTYWNCSNLTSAEIGPKVINTDSCFINCTNLANVNISNGASTIGNSAFRNCSKIEGIIFPSSITSIRPNAFNGCSNLISYDFRNHTMIPALNGPSAFYNINSQCIITVPTALYSDWVIATNWSSYADYILPDSTEPGIISLENDTVNLDINKTKTIDIMIVNFEDVNSINVSAVSDKAECVTIGNITKVQKNAMSAIISVELITAELEEDTNITLTVSSDKATVDYTFVAKVEEVVVSYTVESVDGASYGFALNGDYYENQNQQQNSTAALCKVIINNPYGQNVIFNCSQSSESSYDYGILSNVGSTLTTTSTADSSGVKQSCRNMSGDFTVEYGAIEGTIYVKYRKDSSASNGTDTFKFKVEFE